MMDYGLNECQHRFVVARKGSLYYSYIVFGGCYTNKWKVESDKLVKYCATVAEWPVF